jgi:hypothetical protein
LVAGALLLAGVAARRQVRDVTQGLVDFIVRPRPATPGFVERLRRRSW